MSSVKVVPEPEGYYEHRHNSPPPERKKLSDMYTDEFADLLKQTMREVYEERDVKDYAKNMQQDSTQANDYGRPLGLVDNVFGTIGSTLHGITDVAEGLIRGVIDVGTLGKARR